MNKAELEAFVAVVQFGNFTAAAQHLNLSQSALSRRISILESSVGASLLERRRGQAGHAVATKAGRALLRHAEAALTNFHEGLDAIRAVTREYSNEIVLAFASPLCGPSLIRTLISIRDLNPTLDFSLRNGNSQRVSDLVRSGEATLGLRYRKDPDRNIASTVIGKETTAVICAPDHPLLRYPVVQAEQLANEVWIAVPTRPEEPDSGVPTYLAHFGLLGHRIMPINDHLEQRRLIEAGFGIGLVTRASVENELRSGSLHVLNVPQMLTDMPIVMTIKKGEYLSDTALKVCKMLRKTFEHTLDSQH